MRFEVGQVGNGMMINRNYGEGLWTLIETPLRYIPNPSGYSQTMVPLGDGREILRRSAPASQTTHRRGASWADRWVRQLDP